MSIIIDAMTQIENQGLNKIRCYLTGAPYATIESDEIRIALEADVENDPAVTVDRLVDHWQLKALTFNSQMLPSLRGVGAKSLIPMMNSGQSGQVKTLTYLLTRLLFPHLGSEPMPSEEARDRMLFSTHLFDTAMKWDYFATADYVQKLVVIDSYCSMPYWHTLWAFESQFSKLGIEKAPVKVRETFADPLRIADDVTLIDSLIKYLYNLMLFVSERDGAAGKPGNRLAQQIMLVAAQHLPKIVIPHFQKQLSEADRLRLEERRRLESRKETRVAWSATNGRGNGPIGSKTYDAQRLEKSLLDQFKAAKAKKASTPKKAAATPAKPATKMQEAFTSLNIDSNVLAAFAKLAPKK